jgi:hypothetical protein
MVHHCLPHLSIVCGLSIPTTDSHTQVSHSWRPQTDRELMPLGLSVPETHTLACRPHTPGGHRQPSMAARIGCTTSQRLGCSATKGILSSTRFLAVALSILPSRSTTSSCPSPTISRALRDCIHHSTVPHLSSPKPLGFTCSCSACGKGTFGPYWAAIHRIPISAMHISSTRSPADVSVSAG